MNRGGLGEWREVGVAVHETHTRFAESAQGVASDGNRWFVVSNRSTAGLIRKITDPRSFVTSARNSRRVGVYRIDGTKTGEVGPEPEIWAELVRRNRLEVHDHHIHFGAPCWALGSLLVPTQRPAGVWVLSDNLTHQDWWPDPLRDRPERFSWLAHEPGSGLLFTGLFHRPATLQALEWESLRRVASADVQLGESSPRPVHVQGGAFLDAGRILLSSSHRGGQVFAYSVPDGRWLDLIELGDYFEMEGLTVQACQVGGAPADVHILEAATDYWPFIKWGDSFSVRSYRIAPPTTP
jgi:hypothetical protein